MPIGTGDRMLVPMKFESGQWHGVDLFLLKRDPYES